MKLDYKVIIISTVLTFIVMMLLFGCGKESKLIKEEQAFISEHNCIPDKVQELQTGEILTHYKCDGAYELTTSNLSVNDRRSVAYRPPRTDNSDMALVTGMVVGSVMNNNRSSRSSYTPPYRSYSSSQRYSSGSRR